MYMQYESSMITLFTSHEPLVNVWPQKFIFCQHTVDNEYMELSRMRWGLMGLLHPQWHNCLAASRTQRNQRIQSFSSSPAAGQRRHCGVQQAWPSPTQKIYGDLFYIMLIKPWKDGTGWWYFIMPHMSQNICIFPLTHSVIYCTNNVEYNKPYWRFKYKACSFQRICGPGKNVYKHTNICANITISAFTWTCWSFSKRVHYYDQTIQEIHIDSQTDCCFNRQTDETLWNSVC